MESRICVEIDTSPNVLLPVYPSREVPKFSRAVFNFLFGCNIDRTPVYQYLLKSSTEEAYTVVFYRDQKQVGSLTVSRDVLSQEGLYSSLVIAVGKGKNTHSCVLPIRLSPPTNTRDVEKYIALSLVEIFSSSAVEYIIEFLLLLSGVASFVFPSGLPMAAATSGVTMATMASGPTAAAIVTTGIVVIGIDIASGVLKSIIRKQKVQYRYPFYRWLGTRRLPANVVGTYFGGDKTVKGIVLNEQMNHPTWGFGFIYVRQGEENTGICLSTDILPQGEVSLGKFSAISGATVRVFGSRDSYEFDGGKQKTISRPPLSVTFVDVRKSWEKAMSNTTYRSAEGKYTW